MNALATVASGELYGSGCMEDSRRVILLPYHIDSQSCLSVILILMEDQICLLPVSFYSRREVEGAF